MPESKAHVIDDDVDARDSLAFLLSTADIEVETYPSAHAFLEVARDATGVVITDVRMPEMDGIELVRRLNALGVALPIIVVTGHADVPLAVEAMKAGVLDFIEKPYDDETLLGALRTALNRLNDVQAKDRERADFLRRFETLTPRERQVMEGLVAGKANKVIAYDLDISQRTVEIYRAHVMNKSQARSLSELVRMAIASGVA